MKKVYRLENLDCANCAAKIERAVAKLNGVEQASVNFMMQKMTLELQESDFERIDQEVRSVCRKVEPDCIVK